MSEWQPVETAPTEGYILLSLANCSIPMIGRYEEDENGGAFYAEDDDKPLLKYGIFVNGWMELPKCIRLKGEKKHGQKDNDADRA